MPQRRFFTKSQKRKKAPEGAGWLRALLIVVGDILALGCVPVDTPALRWFVAAPLRASYPEEPVRPKRGSRRECVARALLEFVLKYAEGHDAREI